MDPVMRLMSSQLELINSLYAKKCHLLLSVLAYTGQTVRYNAFQSIWPFWTGDMPTTYILINVTYESQPQVNTEIQSTPFIYWELFLSIYMVGWVGFLDVPMKSLQTAGKFLQPRCP